METTELDRWDDKLLPCPFCGSSELRLGNIGHYYIQCPCGGEMHQATGPQYCTRSWPALVDAWNARAPKEPHPMTDLKDIRRET